MRARLAPAPHRTSLPFALCFPSASMDFPLVSGKGLAAHLQGAGGGRRDRAFEKPTPQRQALRRRPSPPCRGQGNATSQTRTLAARRADTTAPRRYIQTSRHQDLLDQLESCMRQSGSVSASEVISLGHRVENSVTRSRRSVGLIVAWSCSLRCAERRTNIMWRQNPPADRRFWPQCP
jgi:ElaB/YqjD/DUF883 family membrane-anchored ribosome-binding protein